MLVSLVSLICMLTKLSLQRKLQQRQNNIFAQLCQKFHVKTKLKQKRTIWKRDKTVSITN